MSAIEAAQAAANTCRHPTADKVCAACFEHAIATAVMKERNEIVSEMCVAAVRYATTGGNEAMTVIDRLVTRIRARRAP